MKIKKERFVVLNEKPFIGYIKNFLSYDMIQAFLKIIEKENFKKSAVVTLDGSSEYHDIRTSSSSWFSTKYELDEIIRKNISQLINQPIKCFENTAITKYQKGKFYGPHCDYIHYGENNKTERPRIATAIIYLTDNFSGGETNFPKLNLSYKPKAGDLLFFSYDYDGETNKLTLHEGKPVENLDGEKIIMTYWIKRKKNIFNIYELLFD